MNADIQLMRRLAEQADALAEDRVVRNARIRKLEQALRVIVDGPPYQEPELEWAQGVARAALEESDER